MVQRMTPGRQQAMGRQAAGQKMYGRGFQQASANPGGMSRFQDTATPHRMAANRASPNRGTMGMGNPPGAGAFQRNQLGPNIMGILGRPGQGGSPGRLGGASPRGMWAQGAAARPMNAGPQGMGAPPVNVAQRFNPGQAAGNRRVTPPFQKFQGGWGPRTKGFQAPGKPNRDLFANRMPQRSVQRNVNPNAGRPAFAALPGK